MKINATSANAEARLDKELEKVQAKCTARTITGSEIVEALESITESFEIAKVKLNGCTVTVDLNAQQFPNAYRYIPESTHFIAENHGGKWTVIDVYRGQTRSSSNRCVAVLTDEAKGAIIESHSHFDF